ncbi:hypothetical protein SDC9_80250 [bioreactor metagenome]|uniref:Uncharacterized protein n=1 Tax=bioreactor metagenome TaxID=1076179 RepID=A0A644Z4N2_9ZZZZ
MIFRAEHIHENIGCCFSQVIGIRFGHAAGSVDDEGYRDPLGSSRYSSRFPRQDEPSDEDAQEDQDEGIFRTHVSPLLSDIIYFINVSIMFNTAGPRMTTNNAGNIKNTIGKSILVGIFAACVSARCRLLTRIVSA